MSRCVKCGNELLTGDIHWEKGLCPTVIANCKKAKVYLNSDFKSMFIAYSKILEDKDQQLAELKAENERLKASITLINQNIRNSAKVDYNNIKLLENEIEVYRQQLKEKDEAIETLKWQIEQDDEYIWQLREDYRKANALGLEPSYIKEAIRENSELNRKLEELEGELQDKADELCILDEDIKEKDNEIEMLNKELNKVCAQGKDDLRHWIELEAQLKTNTQQVCEKIRDRMQNIEFNCDTDFQSMIAILDQIGSENIGGKQ